MSLDLRSRNVTLRDYQQRALDQLYAWFGANETGNPCLVLPTGSGKSHIVAALCRDALQNWPETRVLMLTHVKEILEQNSEKLRQHWPNAPMGIYSASIGRKQLGEPITFAGIQSIRKKASSVGHVDLCIVDECFVAGTLVATPRGSVAIDNVRPGDIVLNQSGLGVVEATSIRQCSEIYTVELSNGRTIQCTGNHRFFTESGWREARTLANGARLFSQQDMCALWNSVPSLDQAQPGRINQERAARKTLGKATILLRQVCQEVQPYGIRREGQEQNQRTAEGNQASTYPAWRERAIAAFAAVGSSARARGRMGSGAPDQNDEGTQERDLPELLQSGSCVSGQDGGNRTGRRRTRSNSEARTGRQESATLGGVGVVRVSRLKLESPVAVFNLHVSGHPSYFAGGVAVHNCHLIGHEAQGGYRDLIAELTTINPALRVIGLTATPYRLGHGYITDAPAIFSDLIEPVTIEELLYKGHLAPLRSKLTGARLDVTGVHKRGGEYVESELQAAVDTDSQNRAVVAEIIARAEDRKAWLIFCAGVKHAEHVDEILREHGIASACITGETAKVERADLLRRFKSGELRALTNANVLTTGFDHPDVDLVAFLRPTMSPVLYVQMAGRGMRPKSHTDHCLVLDFAGNVERHGPVTAVQPPDRKVKGEGGEAPSKTCSACGEICAAAARICTACGAEFPPPVVKPLHLRNDDIMGKEPSEMPVASWAWRKHTSFSSGKEMLRVTYYGQGLSSPAVDEYFTVLHDGEAGRRAWQKLARIAGMSKCKAGVLTQSTLQEIADAMNDATPPAVVKYLRDGKFYNVMGREWSDEIEQRNDRTAEGAAGLLGA